MVVLPGAQTRPIARERQSGGGGAAGDGAGDGAEAERTAEYLSHGMASLVRHTPKYGRVVHDTGPNHGRMHGLFPGPPRTRPKRYHSEIYPPRTTVVRRPRNSPIEAGIHAGSSRPGGAVSLLTFSRPARIRSFVIPTPSWRGAAPWRDTARQSSARRRRTRSHDGAGGVAARRVRLRRPVVPPARARARSRQRRDSVRQAARYGGCEAHRTPEPEPEPPPSPGQARSTRGARCSASSRGWRAGGCHTPAKGS